MQPKDKQREKERTKELMREKEEEEKFRDLNNTALAAIEGRSRSKQSSIDTPKSIISSVSGLSRRPRDAALKSPAGAEITSPSAPVDGASLPASSVGSATPTASAQQDAITRSRLPRSLPLPFAPRDVLHVLAQDAHTRRSTMFYKALYNSLS
eukprot:TRINITY_DN6221_c0_g1_i1.p1 TRINITY_DN6221_c0_g1~~TRINITY_DN6221_c0_g1_i1.p1  ORF type:complete len:153 (+),score=29.29 TRINITY_DN6221_c0_g1_i1:160-618(+)